MQTPSASAYHQTAFTLPALTFASGGSWLVAVMAGCYVYGRRGFPTDMAPILCAVALSWFIMWCPLVAKYSILRWRRTGAVPLAWYMTDGALTLATVIVIIIASYSAILSALVLVSGAVLGIGGSVYWLRRSSLLFSIAVIIGTFVLAVWAAGVCWGSGYAQSLFMESLAVQRVHRDTLFLASFSALLTTYGHVTTGLDGLPYVSYHFGSAWLFMHMARLLQVPALSMYVYGYGLIVVPNALVSLLRSSALLQDLLQPWRAASAQFWRDYRWWLLFLLGVVGFLPPAQRAAFTLWNSSWASESNGTALWLLLCILMMALATLVKTPHGWRPRMGTFWLLIFPPLVGLLSATKVSFGFVLLPATMYWLWRNKTYWPFSPNVRGWVVAGLAILVLIMVYQAVRVPTDDGVELFSFIKHYVKGWPPLWFFLHFGWSWLYILGRVRAETRQQPLWTAWRSGRLADAELIAVVAVIGSWPGLLLNIHGGSAFYFSDIQRWFALVLVLGSLPALPTWRVDRRWANILLGLVASGLILWNSIDSYQQAVRWNTDTRAALGLRADQPLDLEQWNQRPKVQVLRTLEQLAALPVADKAVSLLYIPFTNTEYWSMHRECFSAPFVATSITGIALLDGLPPPTCPAKVYGYWAYTLRTTMPPVYDNVQLCAMAHQRGPFRQVIIFAEADSLRMVLCTP